MAGAPHIYTDTIFHDYPSVFSTKLELLCFNDYFYITVDVGSPEIFPTTGLFVDVLYAFSGDDITAVNFDKLNYQQSQWLVERQTNEVAVMPPGDKERNLFLTDIRNHTAFYISIANPDGGVNTMYFDITGAEDSIDPVLAACNVS